MNRGQIPFIATRLKHFVWWNRVCPLYPMTRETLPMFFYLACMFLALYGISHFLAFFHFSLYISSIRVRGTGTLVRRGSAGKGTVPRPDFSSTWSRTNCTKPSSQMPRNVTKKNSVAVRKCTMLLSATVHASFANRSLRKAST